MMPTRDLPGWASPSTDPTDRYVVCGGCEGAMLWSRFVDHLKDCGDQRFKYGWRPERGAGLSTPASDPSPGT